MTEKPLYEKIYDYIKDNYCDIKLRKRMEPYKTYRRFYYLICHKYCLRNSYKEISNFLDGRDHATMLHNYNKALDLISVYESDKIAFNKLEHEIIENVKGVLSIENDYIKIMDFDKIKLQRRVLKLESVLKQKNSKIYSLTNDVNNKRNTISRIDGYIDLKKKLKSARQSRSFYKKKYYSLLGKEVILEKVS